MKVRYKGPTFGGGFLGLTDGKIYECVGVEYDLLRIIDDEGAKVTYFSGPDEIKAACNILDG